ncbi:heterokaryon incompatibility protein-domain-containing protein [Cladorrhinum sp. PSN259]|nr:heterokaryon incompatibility protein-domain-containing protein [Cladorrhinum sp. PSN259]
MESPCSQIISSGQQRPLKHLDDSHYSTRLLHLLPAADDTAGLRCQLIEQDFYKTWSYGAASCDYHALSYAWGNPVFPDFLEVVSLGNILPGDQGNSGTECLGIIPITRNLCQALKRLRRKDATLVLWVDAVCIDQNNVAERSSQVSNMAKIYTRATSVIVWLGDDSYLRDGQLCMSFFQDLERSLTASNNHQVSASWRKRFQINELVAKFLDRKSSKGAIMYFLGRAWFRRRWVVQEVVLAKSVVLHCGAWNVPWNTFHLAITELFENGYGVFPPDRKTTMRTMMGVRHGGSTITAVRNIGMAVKKQLPLDTLVEFSTFLCANPRDRLYALYGVIKRWCPRQVSMQLTQMSNVDYSLSTEHVFTNFAVSLMQIDTRDCLPMTSDNAEYKPVTHVLQLAAAFGHQKPGHDGFRGKIPSWAVDWTGTLGFEPLQHSPKDRSAFKAIRSEQLRFLPTAESPRLLVMVGLPFDVVTACITLDSSPMLVAKSVQKAKGSLNAFLSKVAECVDVDLYQPTSQHLITALAITLVANWEHTPQNSYFGQDPRFIQDFLKQLENHQYHLPEILHKWLAYLELIGIVMRGRSLFLTAKGYMGIASTGVTVGDIICLLDNQSIPFILRPQHTSASTGEKTWTRGTLYDINIPRCFYYHEPDSYERFWREFPQDPGPYNTFRVISDAYVHGLMNGEVLRMAEGERESLRLRILPIE